ncbi:hypothetical protein J6590_035856 [Homalodisca vitripennis]|nr:hypothetical protein J6590_035856 [Homalodisca vitripennis]
MGLIVDKPKPGYGNPNDGNSARNFFKNPALDVHKYDTRGGDSYRMQHHRTLASEQLPLHAGVKLIINLPESIKNSNNPTLFKA